MGVFHTDRRDRASLALDPMEAVRPTVDAYLLALLTQRTLAARDLVETRKGGCKITPRLAGELATTCDLWACHIAPVVEWAANTLASYASSEVPVRSPLTQSRRRAAVDKQMPDRKRRVSRADFAVLPNACRECGAPLSDHRRRYCDDHRRQKFNESGPGGRVRAAEVLAQLRSEQRDLRTVALQPKYADARTQHTSAPYVNGKANRKTPKYFAARSCPNCGRRRSMNS